MADRQHKQHRQHKPDGCPDGISRVLPAVFNNTGYACNESSNENDSQYPCRLVIFVVFPSLTLCSRVGCC
jgi:hypothetical protein